MLILKLVIIQVITFIGLVFALRKIMYAASLLETKRLQQLSLENAKKAQELAVKIEEAEHAYKEKMASADEESKKLKAQAKEEMERIKEELLNKARQESEHIITQALNSKEKLREEIEAQLQDKSIEGSLKLIQRVMSSKHQRLVHSGLIDELLEELEKLEPQKLEIGTDRGELVTPYELEKEKKEKIVAIFSRKLGKKISLEEKVEQGIIAGIIIKFGNFIIDGSLEGKLREAAEATRA